MEYQKKILVVEDELTVRTVIVEMLGLLGYSIFVADSKSDALKLFPGVDLVLQDVILENWGCNGLELLKEYKQLNSNIKVVIMSAYTGNISWSDFEDAGAIEFWQKPFSLQTIKQRLKEILK